MEPQPDADTEAGPLSIINHPPSRLPGPALLHHLVQAVPREDDAPAIEFLAVGRGRTFLTYAAMHQLSNALAAMIASLVGSQLDSESFIVPVLLPQCPDLYVALLAILKAGGAFCPLNLDIPTERAKLILNDVAAKVIITTSKLSARLPQDGDRVTLLLDTSQVPSGTLTPPPYRRPQSGDLAYVMYTSGSTGTPKGVGVSHEAVTQSLLGHELHIPDFSRFLQFAAPTFDVSVFEIFFPLMRGRTLVGCERSMMLNDLPLVIRTMNVDACELTPSVAGSLLRTQRNAPSLRLLLTIGEMLTGPVVAEFGGCPGRPSILWGMYGPTEAAIHCTVQPAFGCEDMVGNIGAPFDTVSAFIIQAPEDGKPKAEEFKVLPRGEAGELAIGGYQIAREYINRPDQTAAAFINTPYGRLYRTGDKARVLPDGTLECLGRIGFGQVKLRGQRVELGEVEHAALRTPGCHGAFAVIINNILVLFCAVDEIDGIVAAISKSCEEWLPGFMIPGDIVAAKDFPRLPSGKVDRKLLAADYVNVRESDTANLPKFADGLERQLCDLAGQVLAVTVYPHENLSKKGMDSLAAIKYASRLRGVGIDVGAVHILASQTVSALHARLLRLRETSTKEQDGQLEEFDIPWLVAQHPCLQRRLFDIVSVTPSTPLQASMLAETVADPRAYCNWVELSFPTGCSPESIRVWFLQLVGRNEILRTGFIHHEGRFLQIIFGHLDESQVTFTVSGRQAREFEMYQDEHFLKPLRIQILGTTVIIQMHHAIYDGWSMDLMLSDLESLSRGESLGPTRTPFRRISDYLRSADFKGGCDTTKEFWAEHLAGFQVTTLPNLMPGVATTPAVINSTRVSLDMSPETIRKRLHQFHCSTQALFQAALAWLWGTLIGADDIVLGVVTSGRTWPISGIETTIGPCIASVPIRTILSNARTIKDLLADIHTTNRSAIPHSALPLAEIKRITGISSGQAVYDVLFVYQESLTSKEKLSGTIKEVDRRDYLETKLLVEVEPGVEDISCHITWHSDILTKDYADLMGKSIMVVVAFMMENLDSALTAVQGAFPQQLLSVYNQEPRSFSGVPDLAHAVEQIASKYLDKDALCFADHIASGSMTATTLTYEGLNTLANRIAWHLREQGARENDVVAILMEKSVLLYAGILAILKVGCAYLPLLPSTPPARIGTIFRQAGLQLCLTDTITLGKLGSQPPCRFLDLQSTNLQDYSSLNLGVTADPSRLSYVIFTSGSTGVPKGVCVTQLNIMSNLDVLSRIYPVKEDSRLLQSCSQAFDVSVFEIFFAWTQGMCLCSGTNDTLFEDLERSIRKLNVTHLSMTPTVASLIDPGKTPKVEFLVTAGEAMTEVVSRKWEKQLYQGYGPSETTNICSVKKMGPDQNIRHLGWPFENTSTVVLFQNSDKAAPMGCLGELCFGGDQVAQGYLRQSDLTLAKFINHPKFGRLYRSGDLGRMLPDGSMIIIGRIDDQIKIRGQRVELGEITSMVRQSTSVIDCATLFFKKDNQSSLTQIVTFVVLSHSDGTGFRIVKLDEALTSMIQAVFRLLVPRLPSYMVPSFIIPISVLPTTASGKLNRSRLVAAFGDLDQGYLASACPAIEATLGDNAWSASERQVADVISEVFRIPLQNVPRWTPLTTVGLDSISAIEVAKKIQKRFGRRLAISSILQNATVSRLAQALAEVQAVPLGLHQELLPQSLKDEIYQKFTNQGTHVKEILPCMPLQEAMLASSSGGVSYLNHMLLEIVGDPNRLREVWVVMCRRHDILRTCFATTSNSQSPIVQVILDAWEPPWHEMANSEDTLDACISAHVNKIPAAIDSMEPAVSFAVLRRGGEAFLSFVCHHALYDGVAIQRLLFEVEQQLSGVSLPPPPSYAEFLQAALSLPPGTDRFWAEHLDGFQPKLMTQLNTNDPEKNSMMLCYEIPTPLSSINDKAKQLGVSLLSLSQAAWAATAASLFRSCDVCFGNIVSGRSAGAERVDEIVAPCFNTVPIRIDLADKRRNLDLMKALQRLNPNIIAYQFTPLRRIQSLFLSNGGRRLFDTLLLLQQPSRPLDASVWRLLRDDGDMDVPVVCELLPDVINNVLYVKIHVERNRFPRWVADLILELFLHSFESCLLFPASAISLGGKLPVALRDKMEELPAVQVKISRAVDSTREEGEEWTSSELIIRDVLSILGRPDVRQIRPHTTIYQLGLDSISAVQIASILRGRGYNVSASDVIENPTCESLARYLDIPAINGTQPAPIFDTEGFQVAVQQQVENQGILIEATEAILPCTPLQAGMVAQFIKSGGRDYLNFISFEANENIDAATLAEGWRIIHGVYPILRTGFVSVAHDACSFAMVQHRQEYLEVPTDIISQESSRDFDYHKWRHDTSSNIARALHHMAWRVAITQSKKRCVIHLGIHHAIYDAQSLHLILSGLTGALGCTGILRPPPTEDVVVDILGQLSSSNDSSEKFWKGQAEKTVVNKFPIMTPLRETTNNIVVESNTSTEFFRTLECAAASMGYSFQTVLQAAWTRLLSSYLGEDSVVYGVVLSGRTTDTTRDAVFPCITTLPVISTNLASNRGLLEQIQSFNIELYKQQHQPLAQIQQWLGHPEGKLFDTLLVYQKFDIDNPEPQPWRILEDHANIDYPVSIEIEPQPNGTLRYQITFFSDVLPVEQSRVLLVQFDAIVRHLCSKPDENEADLFKLSPEMFSVLPAKEPDLPSTVKLLHHFAEIQASAMPQKTALHFVDSFDGAVPIGRQWSYAELNENGNRVANALFGHVKVGDVVAIDFDKCPEAFFSILGILKAGCSFVALDPGAPAARKEFIVKDSDASVVLTSKTRVREFGFKVSVPIFAVDQDFLERQTSDPPNLSRNIEPSDVCYCLYTSGTTGTPKGCEITHDNAVQCMLAFQTIFDGHWEESSRWLQFASLHFDVSVLEQYWSWSVGITLVSAPRDLILEDLAGTISKLDITHIDLTPSLARLLHPDDVPSLCRGIFITGGESLKQEILDVWGSKAVIYNFYGPTEATIGVTVYPRVPKNGRSSNIGRQFINVGSYVLRPGTENPVLRGAVGELCVSGRLVGKGYLNREELTTERFPTLRSLNERVYRTGDLARVLHDGCFDFLGRADDQVKLRGQRLEIGEINHAIKTGVDGIKDVATLVVRIEAQQKDFLVSFIVAGTVEKQQRTPVQALSIIKSPEASDLCRRARQECRSRLPGYIVPTYVFQLSYIPLSANNKAELKQLKALFNSLSQDELVTLSSPTERSPGELSEVGKRIAAVLAAMNCVEPSTVTPSSNIFELGVDSISVLRFSSALKKAGLVQASPATILKNPIVDDLVHALETSNRSSVAASVAGARQLIQACSHRHRVHVCKELGVEPEQISYIAPCSPLQQGMISRSTSDGAYFNRFVFQLANEVSTIHLRDAWQRVMDVFPIMRTHFVDTIDGYAQVALKSLSLPWREEALDAHKGLDVTLTEKRATWVAQNQESFNRPWELLVFTSSQGADSKRLMVLHIFHGLYDANSLKLILDTVASKCHATWINGVSSLEKAPTFLEALCHGPLRKLNGCREFWIKHLEGVSTTSGQLFREPQGNFISSERRLSGFPESYRAGLGVTHQAVVQAAWVLVLAKHFSVDPTIGVITSGRALNLDGADNVVGPIFNVLPFRSRIYSEMRNRSILSSATRQCHEFNTAVLDFQHVPLRDIQKWCSRGKPLFDTLFSFERAESTGLAAHGIWVELESESQPDYPLALEATLWPDGRLQLLIVSRGNTAGGQQLQELMDDMDQCLTAMSQDGELPATLQPVKQNGHVKEQGTVTKTKKVNGGSTQRDLKDKASNFKWTETAVLVRQEIALLAGLSTEMVAETTSILELGLDSIDVIRLSARLKKYGIKLKGSQIMKAGTISNIVLFLSGDRTNRHALRDGNSNLHRTSDALKEYLLGMGADLEAVDIILPATPLQDSMMAEMVHSDFQLYFNHDVMELSPDTDVDRLKVAWHIVVSGSPILRTTFISVDSPDFDFAYCQVVNKEPRYYVDEVDLDSYNDTEKLMDAATRRARKGNGRSGLLQLVFARFLGQRFLVLSIAHALYDGWSLGLLHRDVEAAYHGIFHPRPFCLEYLEQNVFSADDTAPKFWSGFLEGAQPTLIPETELHSRAGGVHRAEAISSSSTADVRSFRKRYAITMQTLGQACWAAVLASRVHSLDVTFGVVLSGRESELSESLMFPTMNTVALRSILHGTVSSWLQYMQENLANVSAHQHFPLRKAQKCPGGVDGPLFNTLFIQQRPLDRESELGDEPLMRSVGGSSSVEYPLCVEMEVFEDRIIWRTACEGKYVSREDALQLPRQLDAILGTLLRHPDADVLNFSGQQVSICGLPPLTPDLGGNSTPTLLEDSTLASDTTWSSREELIRSALAEISGVSPSAILKTHTIYHLGLDSISAIKVCSVVRKQGLSISVRNLLKAKSISEMASSTSDMNPDTPLREAANGKSYIDDDIPAVLGANDLQEALARAGIDGSTVEKVLPATAMQVHMLSVWQNTNGNVFFPVFKFKIVGNFTTSAIHAAWQTLIQETPILRTTFVSTTSREVPILQVLLHEPTSPHASLAVFQVEGDFAVAQVRIHHALYDAFSWAMIRRKFAALCRGESDDDWNVGEDALWWRTLAMAPLQPRVAAQRKEFWTKYLAGCQPKETWPRLTCLSSDSRARELAVTNATWLRSACRAKGLSVTAGFLAVYAQILAGRTPGPPAPRDLVFGVYSANRPEKAVPYPTLCLLPLRVHVAAQPDLLEMAEKIHHDLQEMALHSMTGLWEIKDWTGITVDSFVNFLASQDLPDGIQAVDQGILDVDENISLGEESEIVCDYKEPVGLEGSLVRDAYPDAVDVEVSMDGYTMMTIGVFGPRSKLPGDTARGLIKDLVEVLRGD